MNFFKSIRNNSDSGAVLNAGWQAMQQIDPRLAAAVQKLPPQLQQQAVLQYTNAIRMGKDNEASAMATQTVRTQLAEMAKQPAPQSRTDNIFARIAARRKPYGVEDFDRDLTPPAQQEGGAISAFSGLRKFASAPDQKPSPQQAFQAVREKSNAYNGPQEVIFPWDKPAQKELSAPKDWAIPQNQLIKTDSLP